ncbi:hypothetical protein GF337_00585 [candidate division KSB1 bacterium]|nr:hypothetical protein [candidate division KSB1 bacterium]
MPGKYWLPIIFLLLLSNCSGNRNIENILDSTYQTKMISSGNNSPTIDLRQNHLSDLIVLLHHRIALRNIQNYFTWSDEKLNSKLDTLLHQDLIKRLSLNVYVPTCMVISRKEGRELQELADLVAPEFAEIIIHKIPDIKNQVDKIDALKKHSFSSLSFLILSNVLMDNWQIDNIESKFLKAERPLRNGKHFYFSLQERSENEYKEPFGIYGNEMKSYGNIMVGIYGNQRYAKNFINLNKNDLNELFGMSELDDIDQFKHNLLEELIRQNANPEYPMEEICSSGFNKIGLMAGDSPAIPILSRRDYSRISKIAGLITNELIRFLEQKKHQIMTTYQNSRYENEITFEEYFIWWYHFFYTKVTNLLAAKGFIEIPKSGYTTYIIKWS